MLWIMQKGGPLMYPIFACSVLALGIFLERLLTFVRVRRGTDILVREVESLVINKRIDEALIVCQRSGTPLSRILIAALRLAGRPREEIKIAVDEVGSREAAPLERYLGLLGTIATISPLLGLLGTVLGMIEAFNVISVQGVGTPATLGGGISQALITTAAGLSVAIPVILLHKYLSSRVDRVILEMETCSLHIVDLLRD
ncbi:biopolymer transport protein ExbB/TolQ [Desulfuromonas soudanensis]|uniref:Biopolymer transport protein ExbB/TolQ n=1 Tax=Desulfuromonas soudanensis TaxID=1603606 RepID=A0A0M5INR6_9BACT|nr:MotA/TolQ/ExbB proton channel family protein [Desulfuromonas soudanensis]ALC16824.1 biopolymer transport protein ExbB/TolQ [Desulfuromonas soudanensis]